MKKITMRKHNKVETFPNGRKVSPQKERAIYRAYHRGQSGQGPRVTQVDLAIKYKIHPQMIYLIVHGLAYKKKRAA